MRAARWVRLGAFVALAACTDVEVAFDPTDPARGPGQLVGADKPLNDSFAGGVSKPPAALDVPPPADDALPVCGDACESHCASLPLDNPVDRGMCRSTWGVGLGTRPVVAEEACRRIWADVVGRYPTRSEVADECAGRSLDSVVLGLIQGKNFVRVNQRRWADTLRYSNRTLSIERIFDMDELTGKLYRGEVAYDQFAAVVSAHPTLTRRYDTPGDRAEALFVLLLGRPPYENERADMARLYTLWSNGYYDHPRLQQRLPDATIRYRCVTETGQVDDAIKGECTSILWGYHELVLKPDFRAVDGEMWSGLLTADEWEKLQLPGRILAREVGFWEHAVDSVLQQYLGYDLGTLVPDVREELIGYVLQHDGDIRAAHYAVLTSQVYLQTSTGETPTKHRWTYGPLKQVEVEPWIDTVKRTTDFSLSRCDHRIDAPEDLIDGSFTGYAVVHASEWELGEDDEIIGDYRDLARTLGGCPENDVGGRFKTVSILTTATQEGFVIEVCNPTLASERGAAIAKLLPSKMDPARELTGDVAEQILDHQVGLYFGRTPTETERTAAREASAECAPKPCTAEAFARPSCFALLTSSEMLFY